MRKVVSIAVSIVYLLVSILQAARLAEDRGWQWLVSEYQSAFIEPSPTVEYESSSQSVGPVQVSVVNFARPVRFQRNVLQTVGSRIRLQCDPQYCQTTSRSHTNTPSCENAMVDLQKSEAVLLAQVLQNPKRYPTGRLKTIAWKYNGADADKDSVVILNLSGRNIEIPGENLRMISRAICSALGGCNDRSSP
jgi:hypothetical protein